MKFSPGAGQLGLPEKQKNNKKKMAADVRFFVTETSLLL